MSINKTFKKTEAIGNTALLLEENKAYSRAAFASILLKSVSLILANPIS